ncbi:MAG: hypothetical protein BWZ07_02913 [Alphaproteobacteria bacterium ADurb.BinA280]|nr:MAG: hypothetical protein BWZ07_02913 [Alphaproteobacteria bacterium ADurb.BinA280]
MNLAIDAGHAAALAARVANDLTVSPQVQNRLVLNCNPASVIEKQVTRIHHPGVLDIHTHGAAGPNGTLRRRTDEGQGAQSDWQLDGGRAEQRQQWSRCGRVRTDLRARARCRLSR